MDLSQNTYAMVIHGLFFRMMWKWPTPWWHPAASPLGISCNSRWKKRRWRVPFASSWRWDGDQKPTTYDGYIIYIIYIHNTHIYICWLLFWIYNTWCGMMWDDLRRLLRPVSWMPDRWQTAICCDGFLACHPRIFPNLVLTGNFMGWNMLKLAEFHGKTPPRFHQNVEICHEMYDWAPS